jgi:hypothetical protein
VRGRTRRPPRRPLRGIVNEVIVLALSGLAVPGLVIVAALVLMAVLLRSV